MMVRAILSIGFAVIALAAGTAHAADRGVAAVHKSYPNTTMTTPKAKKPSLVIVIEPPKLILPRPGTARRVEELTSLEAKRHANLSSLQVSGCSTCDAVETWSVGRTL